MNTRHRGTPHRHSRWEKIAIHPRHGQGRTAVLRADMTRAFVAGDLDLYFQLDQQLRQALAQSAPEK